MSSSPGVQIKELEPEGGESVRVMMEVLWGYQVVL